MQDFEMDQIRTLFTKHNSMSKSTFPLIFYSVCLKFLSRMLAHTLFYGPGQLINENLTWLMHRNIYNTILMC